MCIVFILQQTATFALYNINWFVFLNRDEKCLLRGTNWVFKWNSLRFVFKGLTFTSYLTLNTHGPHYNQQPVNAVTK
jgi:hypothetical protein